jgi:hypothetical protein
MTVNVKVAHATHESRFSRRRKKDRVEGRRSSLSSPGGTRMVMILGSGPGTQLVAGATHGFDHMFGGYA